MKQIDKKLFSEIQSVAKRGTVAMLCTVLSFLFLVTNVHGQQKWYPIGAPDFDYASP